jgi:hypothetical protein
MPMHSCPLLPARRSPAQRFVTPARRSSAATRCSARAPMQTVWPSEPAAIACQSLYPCEASILSWQRISATSSRQIGPIHTLTYPPRTRSPIPLGAFSAPPHAFPARCRRRRLSIRCPTRPCRFWACTSHLLWDRSPPVLAGRHLRARTRPDASSPAITGAESCLAVPQARNSQFRKQVLIGPNAVLAGAREGYSWTRVSLRDALEAASFPGLWRLAARHLRFGLGEMFRSLVLSAQAPPARCSFCCPEQYPLRPLRTRRTRRRSM